VIENWNRIVWPNVPLLLQGLLVSAEICVLGFVAALIAGFVAALVRLYLPPLRWLAVGYIEFCRATPIFVQLVWVAYVWPELFGWPRDFFTAGWVALALQSSGYIAETLRTGIEAVARGHREAAYALGMRPGATLRRIVLPQAFLTVAPSLVNQLIVVVKSSTLVSVIAVPDLLYQVLGIVNKYYEPIEILTLTALIYVAVTTPLSLLLNGLSARIRYRYGYVSGRE
jgi:polar amino acid transport system permease protein